MFDHKVNAKKIIGSLLVMVGISGLNYAVVLYNSTTWGTHAMKLLIIVGVLGLVFFVAGISLIRTTHHASG